MSLQTALDAGASAAYGDGYHQLSATRKTQCRAAVRPIVISTIHVTAEFIANEMEARADMYAAQKRATVGKEARWVAMWLKKWQWI